MPDRLNIAVAQPLVVPGDIEGNVRKMEPLVKSASLKGADLVVFSECGITGYDYDNVATAAAIPADGEAISVVSKMAVQEELVIVAGFYEDDAGVIYNSAIAFYPDGRKVLQRKHNVIAHEIEETPTKPGPRQRALFEVNGFVCAILICADNGMEGIYDELAADGCNVVLAPAAGGGRTSIGFSQADLANPEMLEKYLAAAGTVCFPDGLVRHALRLGMGVAAVNQAGWVAEMDFFHPGHSSVVDRNGDLTALITGRMVFEHLRPDLAIGFVHSRG